MLVTNVLLGAVAVAVFIQVLAVQALLSRLVKGRSSANEFLRKSRDNLDQMSEETSATLSSQRDQMASIEERRKRMEERFAEQMRRSEEMLAVQKEQLAVLNRMLESLRGAG